MKPHFDLITKTMGMSFVKYKGDAVRLSTQTPAKVDEVIIALKDNHDLTRKVTTFRDSKGEIIERSFDYFDKPYRNRLYSYDAHIIQDDEFVTTTTTKDYVLSRESMKDYKELIQLPKVKRNILWIPFKTTSNHFSENEKTGEKILSQTTVTPLKRKRQNRHTFIEFPHIVNDKIVKRTPKFLSFAVKNKDNSVIKKSIEKSGIKLPKYDYFLGFRALTREDSKVPFTEHFLRENKLQEAEIRINKEYNPIREKHTGFTAIFNAEDGVVNFNKDYTFKSKSQVVKTSAHEAEHAKQYFLQALLKGGDTPWQTNMAEKFGALKDEETIAEARIYDEAIEKYVPFWQDREAYNNNTIEKLAQEKGALQENVYDMTGNEIRSAFPHIPKEFL